MGIVIDALVEHADIVDTVARWCHKEWGHLSGPDTTLTHYTAALRDWIDNNSKPTMFVALDGPIPVGSVALTDRDPDSWIDVGPWLGALYVVPGHRGRDIWTQLVRYLIDQARDLDVGTLYASVTDRRLRKLGVRRGWREIGHKLHNDRWVTLLLLDLVPRRQITGDATL